MPTLSQKQNGDYIIRSRISGGPLCTWQVDNGKAINLLRDEGYEVNLAEGAVTEFPMTIFMELFNHNYVSTNG
jgi:hypothetical protein